MKHTMRTTKLMAIALIALATSAGIQTAQAHGKEEKDYVQNLFAITWFKHGIAAQYDSFYLMHWKAEAWVDLNFAQLPIAGQPVKVFNAHGQIIHNALYGRFRLHETGRESQSLNDQFNQKKNKSIVFYLQLTTSQTFQPEKAMKLELFPNRRTARISLHDGFQRTVPVQRYSGGGGTGFVRKELPTAINFGPLK